MNYDKLIFKYKFLTNFSLLSIVCVPIFLSFMYLGSYYQQPVLTFVNMGLLIISLFCAFLRPSWLQKLHYYKVEKQCASYENGVKNKGKSKAIVDFRYNDVNVWNLSISCEDKIGLDSIIDLWNQHMKDNTSLIHLPWVGGTNYTINSFYQNITVYSEFKNNKRINTGTQLVSEFKKKIKTLPNLVIDFRSPLK